MNLLITRSLKKEIRRLLIIFSILVITVIGIVAFVNLYNSKIDITKHNQNLVLKQVKNEIENRINDIKRISSYITKNYSLNSELLKNIVETNNNVSSILILSKEGLIKNFYATTNQNIYKGFDYSHKNYFKNITTSNDSYWSNVFLSTVDEEPSISFSFKIKEDVGVIIIKLTELSHFLYRFRNVDGTHMIRVFDRNGTVIINPDAKFLVQQRFNANNSEVYTELINNTRIYKQKNFLSDSSNLMQHGAYTKVDTTNWKVVVREDYNVLVKSLLGIIVSVVLTILFFIIISIYLSFKISKRIFKSFDALQKTTSEIANGNYDVKTKKFYYTEFEELLESFNKMQIEIDKREEHLENSLNSFKHLFNSTMEAIILHENKTCIDVNDVALKLFGYKNKNEIVGKNIINLVAPSHQKLVVSNYDNDIEPFEVDFLKENGTKFTALAQGKYIKLNGRKLKVSAIIDITELKQKDQLLFQQNKMASMGEMIANIAHQWRQPLSIISTCASGVKFEKELGTLEEKRLMEGLDIIVDNTQYLSKTIDDFRNFFKSNKKVEDFNIKDVLGKTLKLLNASLKNNSINVDISLSDEKIYYEGYPNEFIQVLINIINNSKDAFIGKNVKKRYVKIENSQDSYSYKLSITDNAGGIEESLIEKIFDPYFTTKHQSQGTGIGLYMSHQIISDHMKGEITVVNKDVVFNDVKYQGACFTIEIPKFPHEDINYII